MAQYELNISIALTALNQAVAAAREAGGEVQFYMIPTGEYDLPTVACAVSFWDGGAPKWQGSRHVTWVGMDVPPESD